MTGALRRRLVFASAIAVVLTSALLPGSGLGQSAAVARGTHEIPAGLAAAIHARLGAGAIRSSSAARGEAWEAAALGYSVALSADGTTALVGDLTAHNRAAAYVFHVSDAGSWSSSMTPTAALKKPRPTNAYFADGLGSPIALSADGTTAFVGAPGAGVGAPGGAIYVFHVSTEDAWVSSTKPKATLTVHNSSHLGLALALSLDGTTLVAGAPSYKGGAGGAYVFHVSSEGAWASRSTPTAKLNNSAQDSADVGVGSAVAVSADGTTALLSDSKNPGGFGAYVYHVARKGAWASSSTPTAILSDANAGVGFGGPVALSGDGTVALVSPGYGVVDVFHASGEAAWVSTSTPTASLTGSSSDFFGYGVALSTDGKTALVTAPGVNARRGAAYVFRVPGEGAWASSSAPTATITNGGGPAKHGLLGFGPALSADGATALVGAPEVRYGTGAADVFHVSKAGLWASSSTPTAILTVAALEPCVVPKLIGLTLSAAKSRLRARYCRLGRVRGGHLTAMKGRVVSQSRAPGLLLAPSAEVGVKIRK